MTEKQVQNKIRLNPLGAGLICNFIEAVKKLEEEGLNPLGAGLICNKFSAYKSN